MACDQAHTVAAPTASAAVAATTQLRVTGANRRVKPNMMRNVSRHLRRGKHSDLEQPECDDEAEHQNADAQRNPQTQTLLDGLANPHAVPVEQDGDDIEAH